MNLQPINPPEPVFQFGCYSCGRPFLSTTNLDGTSFAAYFCGPCASVIQDAARDLAESPAYGTANDSEIGPEIYPEGPPMTSLLSSLGFCNVGDFGTDPATGRPLTLDGEVMLPDTVEPLPGKPYGGPGPKRFRPLACALLCLLSLPAFAAPQPCRINVNTATPAELQLFARTGPVLASRLASGRPYKALEAVDAVKGVGEAWLAVNGPHVAFSGETTCTGKVAAPKVPRIAAQAPKL